jgi:hypothetical protein
VFHSPLLIKIISKVRNFIPFNSKLVQSAFIFHCFTVESHFFNYGAEHVFLLTHILLFSLIRSFFMMPTLLFCSLVGDAKSVQTFLMSEKLNHRKNTRQVHTRAAEAVVNTMKSKIDPTKAAAAVGLAAGGVIVERGVDNGEKVDSAIGESYKTARDQQHELPDLQVIQEQKGQQISEERDQYLLEMSAASNSKVLGLFGRPRSFSEPAN